MIVKHLIPLGDITMMVTYEAKLAGRVMMSCQTEPHLNSGEMIDLD